MEWEEYKLDDGARAYRARGRLWEAKITPLDKKEKEWFANFYFVLFGEQCLARVQDTEYPYRSVDVAKTRVENIHRRFLALLYHGAKELLAEEEIAIARNGE